VHVFRALVVVVPPIVLAVAKQVCDELRRSRMAPGADRPRVVRRRSDGGFG
jgi:hypothetical protein